MNKLLVCLAAVLLFSACENGDEPTFITITPGETVEGVWEKNAEVSISSDVVVPEGKQLVIEEGVSVIFTGDSLGTAAAPEFGVRGALIIKGTKANPVIFTVSENLKTADNMYKGLWGGIQCASSCTELAINNAHFEYAGAPAGPNSIFVEQGEDEGDPRYGILFGNADGKYVLHNSTILYTADDANRILGGQISIVNNFVAYNGETGGEAFNIKSGTTGDICYNVFFSGATNGSKWSNSGDNDIQTDVNSYNNTFVNCGWRRNKEGRGGSVNIEKGARGNSYNQLIVNCKYGVRLVGGEDAADTVNVKSDYAYYFANEQVMVDEFYPSHGILTLDDTPHDIAGEINTNDPLFENYDVSLGKLATTPYDAVDFHLKASSPALTGAKTDFTPKIASITIDGTTYTTPVPSAHFGALGTK